MSGEVISILKTVLKSAPELAKEIYGDIAKPGATQVGLALETVAGLGNTLLLPVSLLNQKAQSVRARNFEKLRKQLEEVSVNDIVSVPPEVGVPIVEKLTYVTDDEISDLYVNLLAKASTAGTASQAHPSFANIVSNLSPDEAQMLKRFKNNGTLLFVSAHLHTVPSVSYIGFGNEFLTGIEFETAFMHPQNYPVYLSNFVGLGLLAVRHDIVSSVTEKYEALEKKYRPTIEADPDLVLYKKTGYTDLRFARGRMDVTPFGNLFITACLKKLTDK